VSQPQTVPETAPAVYYLLLQAADVPAAPDWLSPAERAALQRLTVDKRRQDWLLGRWTAKQLVLHLPGMGVLAGDPARLTIHKRADGSPVVQFVDPSTPPVSLTLSLSHSGGVGAAAAVLATGWVLGVDLEQVVARHPAFTADYFTAAEQAQVDAWPEVGRPLAVNAIWSGKEAALKAVRLGLSQDTRAVTCVLSHTSGAADGWAPFTITWDAARVADGPSLLGWWRAVGDYVLTVATQPGPAG
jgi:4'-phosphopantetheinyl transferase